MVQLITHIDGNWLDFAMVSHDFPDVSSLVPDPLPVFRDHFPVEFAINFTSCARETVNPSPKRRFSSINFSEFNRDLADLLDYYNVCQYSDFHNLLTYLNSCLSHCLDKHAPLRVSKVSHTKWPCWMDAEYLAARRKRRSLEKKYRKTLLAARRKRRSLEKKYRKTLSELQKKNMQ